MLRKLKNIRGQAPVAEYLLVLGIVVTAIVTMTVYFRRGFQAKILDADKAMIATAKDRTGPHHQGNWLVIYEPYYLNSTATVTRGDTLRSQLNTTAFAKTYNIRTSAQSRSNTASPMFYRNNLPATYVQDNSFIPLP